MAASTTSTYKTSFGSDVLTTWAYAALFYAQPHSRFMDFASVPEEIVTALPGETIKIPRFSELNGNPILTEGTPITVNPLAGDTVSVTILEYGFAVGVTEKLMRLSPQNLAQHMGKQLGRHYGKWGPERRLRDEALIAAGAVQYAGAATSRATIASTDKFSVAEIMDAVLTLENASAPRFVGDGGEEFFVCIIGPKAARDLKDDPAWVAAQNYHRTRAPFTGEIGEIDGCVVLSSACMPKGGAAAGTVRFWNATYSDEGAANDLDSAEHGGTEDVELAVVFGDRYLAFVPSGEPQLYEKVDTDFDRNVAIAWRQYYGCKVLFADYGVRIEHA